MESLVGYPPQLRHDGERFMPNVEAVIRSGFWTIFASTITIATAALATSSFSDQFTVLGKGSAYHNVCTWLGSTWSSEPSYSRFLRSNWFLRSTWSYSSLSDGAATSSGRRHPGQRRLLVSCICQ